MRSDAGLGQAFDPPRATENAHGADTPARYTPNTFRLGTDRPGPREPRAGTGLYDLRNNMLIRNQEPADRMEAVGFRSFVFKVASGTTVPLRATMVYPDPAGTTSASLHRINDLSLQLVSPTGVKYWGNYGLDAGNWSPPGGTRDKINTVENVFIQSPEVGYWTAYVTADEINADGYAGTPSIVDVVFSLVISGVTHDGMGADWNGDGAVDTSDFAAFLDDFFRGDADFDRDGKTTSADVFSFLNELFAGRP